MKVDTWVLFGNKLIHFSYSQIPRKGREVVYLDSVKFLTYGRYSQSIPA